MSDISVTGQPAAENAQQAQDPGSFPKRIVDTLFSPVALFQRFHTRAPWADVLILSTVLMAALMMLLPRDLMEAQIRESMRGTPMPDGAAAPSMDTMVMMGRIGGVVGQLVAGPLLTLLLAGVCTLVFGKLMGGGGSFRKHLAVISHAGLVTPLGFAITLFFMIQSGNPTTQLSPALLVPGLEEESFAFRLLNALGVFMLWWLALIAAGAYAVNRRVSPAAASAVVLGVYLAVTAAWISLVG
jgi:hypothetical protein